MRTPAALTVALLALSPSAPAGGDAKLDAASVRLKLSGGKLTGSFEYALVVGTYFEWNTDPTAVPGLMSEVTRRTGIRATVRFSPIGLDEDRIRRNPMLIMTGNRFFSLTPAERDNLRRYLAAGGFIYADDCGGADRSFRAMIRSLLPKARLVALKADHPIFRSFYRLKAVPKVLDLYHGKPQGYGAYLGDRLAVFYTYDTDVPCGWEKNPDGSYVHLLTEAKHEQAFRLGVNIVTYALQDLYRRQLRPAGLAATRPASSQPTIGEFLAAPLKTYRMKLQMPCNLIRAIAPAGRYVWFGGRRMMPGEQEGLGRYDYQTGTWQVLLDSEGVLADEINCLATDPAGVWIGTSTIRRRWNYGLWHYDPAGRRSRRYATADGLVDHDVYDLAFDGSDLWVATRSGLARFNLKTRSWSKDPTHCRNYVDLTLCLAVDQRYVWAGRASGLRRYDKKSRTYSHFDTSNSPISGPVNAVALAGDALWISNPPHLLTWRDGKFAKPPGTDRIAAAEVLDAAADAKALCIATRSGGLHVRDGASGKWRVFDRKAGLPSNSVSRVALDGRAIWIAFGTRPLGVGRRDRRTGKWTFHTYRAGIPCNHVYSLACAGRNVYVGTMANGIWRYEAGPRRWVNMNLYHRAEHAPVRRADVYDMLLSDKELWFGTNLGLCRAALGGDDYRTVEGLAAAVAAIARRGETIFCGTKQKGLLAYDTRTAAWTDLSARQGLPRKAVTALACDDRHLWVGTEAGLVLIDRLAAKPVRLPGALHATPVTALLLTDGAVLVGTSAGLLRYRPGWAAPRATGLATQDVHSLAHSPAGVLVGTRTGLALLSGAAARFDKRLDGQLVSALAADKSHLWIGTLGHGLVRAGLPVGP